MPLSPRERFIWDIENAVSDAADEFTEIDLGDDEQYDQLRELIGLDVESLVDAVIREFGVKQ